MLITCPCSLESVSRAEAAPLTSTVSRHRAHLQREVHALPRADVHHDIGRDFFREAPGFGGHLVSADLDVGKGVVAVFVGGGFRLDAGIHVEQRQRRLGDNGSRMIPNGPQDFGGAELRE